VYFLKKIVTRCYFIKGIINELMLEKNTFRREVSTDLGK